MKKNLIAAAVLASSTLGMSAFAVDGQVNFTGEIVDVACQVTNSKANPLKVNLGKVSKSTFKAAGDVASATKFSLQLTACPDTVTSAQVKFDGTSVNGDNSVLALTQDAGVAEGVGIQLSDDSNNLLPLFENSRTYELKPNVANDLSFVARYVATEATVKAGPANSTASFTINYN
ncbi:MULTISPECIES: fimbrial protein [unclassified Serratia (in: enterobacteria)]|uniref:fimbrial protein n=1 Tax=unclassified Serratia (in: enterobacteria) TaxID=2647522 RepID=UPI00046998E1|nr:MULTISPECIES: fimbrial protein [unclassified Serratia (in: enterobacteria)]